MENCSWFTHSRIHCHCVGMAHTHTIHRTTLFGQSLAQTIFLYICYFSIHVHGSQTLGGTVVNHVWIVSISCNNLVLPEWYYKLQFVFQDITFYMVIMGLMILPEFMFATDKQPQCDYRKLPRPKHSIKDSIIYAKHTVVGLIAGCIPGPCADVASAVSFKTQKGGTKDKVVAAETANNSACIFMLIPFFAIGVPITMTSLIMANVLDIKGIEILQTFESQPHLLHQIVGMAMLLNFVNYVLAVRFISVYTNFLKFVQNKILSIQVILVLALVIADIWMSEAQLTTYIPLMCATTCLGCLLKFKRINPIPLVFAMLLGDTLIWTYLQTYYIIF